MNALVAVLLFQVAAAAPAARPVVVQVRDAAKMPVKGAKVLADSGTPAEKVFAETIAKRAGASKEDGLLNLGELPTDQPVSVRIGAPGFRTGTLKLPIPMYDSRGPARTIVRAPGTNSMEVTSCASTASGAEDTPSSSYLRARRSRSCSYRRRPRASGQRIAGSPSPSAGPPSLRDLR